MINRVMKYFRNYSARVKPALFEMAFPTGVPVSPSTDDLKLSEYYVYPIRQKTYTKSIIEVNKNSRHHLGQTHDDILVVSAHGTSDGYIIVPEGTISLEGLIVGLEKTRVGTIVLGSCFGDRIASRVGKCGRRMTIVYNVSEIFDKDASISIRSMVEGLDFWDIQTSVNIINSARQSGKWMIKKC